MEEMTMKDMLMEQIKEILEESELTYDCTEKYFAVPFGEFVVGIEPTDMSLEMKLFERETVEEEYRMDMLRLFNAINHVIKEGHWELEDDERPCFRIYDCLPENEALETRRIAEILSKEFMAHKTFGIAIKRVMYGLGTAEEALEEVLQNISE